MVKQTMASSLTYALVINTVFLVFHPAWASVYPAVLQSFGINVVLFLIPAVPFLETLTSKEVLPGPELVWAMLISTFVFIFVLGFFHLTSLPLTSAAAWNGTWVATNVLLLVAFACGLLRPWRTPVTTRYGLLFCFLFAGSYCLYLYGAVFVVPEQEDHDLEVQATGYGLLTRFEPLLLTDRNTLYYFAHPPLLHYYAAGSFLYYGQSNDLKFYYDATQRALASEQKKPFDPPLFGFQRVGQSDYVPHRILGIQDDKYVISPPSEIGNDQIPIRELELGSIYQQYNKSPHKLETRTPTVFLASLTIALLGCWAATLTARGWMGLLAAAVYATSPEVFVRSSYGGYFAIANWAVLLMLLAAYGKSSDSRLQRFYGFGAGFFAAWSDHKLVLLPIGLVLWQAWREKSLWNLRRLRAVPSVMIGFGVGAMLYWAYGLAINPGQFWLDHVRTHLVDRVLHDNPLGYAGYPSVTELWLEFWQHTGYLIVPLAILCLSLALTDKDEATHDTAGLWCMYIFISALVWSLVDWRMTKHLMPLMPVLYLAPLVWAGTHRKRLLFISTIFAASLLWNLYTVHALMQNFPGFHPSPAW